MKSHVIMFQDRFAGVVESGAKRQTVRPARIRRMQVGDRLSLRVWTGAPYRSRQRIIRESQVTKIATIWIGPEGVNRDGLWTDAEAFAIADGFVGWPDMLQWFQRQHGLPFLGIVITWE